MKKNYKKYYNLNNKLYAVQKKISLQKNKENSDNCKVSNRIAKSKCLKRQDIDKRYDPWPYLDFYNFITKQETKIL